MLIILFARRFFTRSDDYVIVLVWKIVDVNVQKRCNKKTQLFLYYCAGTCAADNTELHTCTNFTA